MRLLGAESECSLAARTSAVLVDCGTVMVIPVGAAFLVQQLMLVEKNADGTVSTRQILPVAFVPLTGGGR